MKTNEFIFWLKGIMDSTQFMPTKKTWDTITDKLKEVDSSDTSYFKERRRIYMDDLPLKPFKRKDNEPPEILC